MNGIRKLVPPCQEACPAHIDIRGYIYELANGDAAHSLEIILRSNPFASVCGRVCFHPCEDACRREKIDSGLSIMRLKRYAADYGNLRGQTREWQESNGVKVAIIGGGPAGLTAAYELALMGYEPVVFEKTKTAGGMLFWGIPDYRLPKQALRKDVNYIKSVGVEVRTGKEIGKNVSWDDLAKEGFSSYIIAVGLGMSRSLPIPGIDAEGVLLAIPFLSSIAAGKPMELGKSVIVIGGGNVAIDVARSAKRLGVGDVKLACLESRDEMPAHEWEIQEALEEGINIFCSKGPKSIIVENGKAVGLRLKDVKCVFDECGRFNPKFHEKRVTVIEGDTIIVTIGQAAELYFAEGNDIAVNERGQLSVDRGTQLTSKPGVFACGEVMTGPGAAVDAIASGKRAALMADAYMQGRELMTVCEQDYEGLADLDELTASKIATCARVPVWTLSPEDRIKSFVEMEQGYSKEEVKHEAERCLHCLGGAEVIEDKCAACLTCERICPFDAPHVERGIAEIDLVRCQACGLCATECPAEAIEMALYKDQRLLSNILAKTKGKPEKIGFVCQYGNLECVGGADELPKGYDAFEVLCPGKLDVNFYLKLFEHGAKSIAFAGCREDMCRFQIGKTKTYARLSRVRELVMLAGYGPDAVFLPAASDKEGER